MPDDDHPLDEHIKSLKKASDGLATFKQRYPARVFQGLGVADEGPSMDSAYSDVNTEYRLGNALERKARKLTGSAVDDLK